MVQIRDQIERRSIDSLVPYARNSRTHSEEQIQQIADSMLEWGWTNPVLVDEDGRIIAGHGRVMAATKLGLGEVPVIVAAGWSEAQRRAYVIADNKLALNAGWDNRMLALELGDLGGMGFDLGLTGFTDDEIHNLDPLDPEESEKDPDDAPGVSDTPVSKLGDVWTCGPHAVMCGSSLELDAWQTLMAGQKADVCWTDPPYNVAYESKLAGKIKNDDMSDAQFRKFLLDAYVGMFSVLKAGAPIYVAHADTEGLNFRAAFIEAGFKLSGCLIWRKNALVLGRSDYQWMHEPILYGWKPGSAHRWYGGRKLTTIIESGESSPFQKLDDGRWSVKVGDSVMVISGDIQVEEHPESVFFFEKPKRSGEHPTMKPVGLIEKMLRASARSGDIVIDAFGGSGSTMIAADRMGMSARLIELDPKFVDVIVRRWQEFTGRDAVHRVTGEKFDEVAARG